MRSKRVRHPIFRHDFEHSSLPAWQGELERLFPRTDRLNWLKIAWEPGMPYAPVQRWVIYEMVTLIEYCPPWIVEDLTGPNPRTVGHDSLERDDRDRVYNAWITDSFLTRNQWILYRETGCYAKKFWVIQGSYGGHLYRLSKTERDFLEERGVKNVDTPLQGDLPYAEPDNRTWERLLMLDKLKTWDENIAWDERQAASTKAGLWVKRDRVREEMAFNVRLRDYLESQVEEAVDSLSRKTLKHITEEAPVREDLDIERWSEGQDEAFISDTQD